MKQDKKYPNHWTSDEGKIIVKKELQEGEEQIKTTSIWIGSSDSIDNYKEVEDTEEQKDAGKSVRLRKLPATT